MKCLIDGDILVYRVGFASQEKDADGNPVGIPEALAKARMDTAIENILKAIDTTDYEVFITADDKSNFRHQIYPEYKANRKAPKPIHYQLLRDWLVNAHGAITAVEQEADDVMADKQTADTVICSIDKDLDQIPGEHYDFVKDVRYSVTPERGLRFFYFQLLTGDRVDNVPGIEGIGPVKAEKILAGIEPNELSYVRRIREEYRNRYKKAGDEMMLLMGRLLKIGGGLWEIPEEPEVKDSEATLKDTLPQS